MIGNKILLALILTLLASNIIFGQDEINNKQNISHKIDTNTINEYIEKAILFHKSEQTDSTVYYIKLSEILANNILLKNNSHIDTSELIFIADTYDLINDFYMHSEDYSSSLKCSFQYLQCMKLLNYRSKEAKLYNSIGNIYKYQSQYEKALNYYQKSLKTNLELNDSVSAAYNHIGIANVFINWRDIDNALIHYEICYQICQRIDDKKGISYASIGIGNIYLKKYDHQKAIDYYNISLEIEIELQDEENIALALNNIGEALRFDEQYQEALSYLFRALDYTRKLKKNIRLSLVLNQIGITYLNLGDYSNAEKYLIESNQAAENANYKKIVLENYLRLSKVYHHTKRFEESYDFILQYNELKDSIFNEEKFNEIAELETKYQTAEKNKQIIIQQKELEASELKLNHEKIIKYIFIIGFLFVLFIIVLIYRSLQQKKKANLLLAAQKKEIEEIHKVISQSIDYATRIQQSILPEKKILEKYTTESFVLFQPKDKVSGDFYWWAHVKNHTIITVSDCTGHGIPGAFMSMLGLSFLREIISKEFITKPGEILEKLRTEIIHTLKQKGDSNEQKDGMDMALISINHETDILQYSGAHSSLYIISHDELQIADNEMIKSQVLNFDTNNTKTLYEIKPNKMPIAIFERMDKFITHEIRIRKGDQVYLFSDGFADQFGGPKNKKIMSKPFKQLLLENADKPMVEQKEILEKHFLKWKGNNEQIDDVTIVGIKLHSTI